MRNQITNNQYAVTAIVSTYNAERFLAARLENLFSQSLYEDDELEIIVVDSGSGQDERQIVDTCMQTHRHIHYLRTTERESVYAAWNRGIRLADGGYVINANTDDRFASRALANMREALDNDPLIHAVYGDWLQTETPNDRFDSATKKVRFEYPEYFAPLLFHGQITSHAVMLRRDIFELLGYYDPRLEVYGDREFMLRFAERGLVARKIKEVIGLYYKNPGGLEYGKAELGDAEFERIMTEYLKPERFIKLFGLQEIPDNTFLAGLYTEAGISGNGFIQIDGQTASNPGTAGRLFAEALAYQADQVVALNNHGILTCCDGQIEKGIGLLEQALLSASDMEREEILTNLNFARKNSADMSEYTWLKTSTNAKETDMETNFASPDQTYDRIQKMDNPQLMMEALKKLIERYPDYAPAHNDLGVLCYKAGDKVMACSHYEKAVELQSENITSKKNLADFYYVEQGMVEKALQLYVEVLEIQPRDVEVLTICGHICVALKRFEDARKFYDLVVEIEPWNSEVRENLRKIQQATAPVDSNLNPEQLLQQAQKLSAGGDAQGAMRLLESVLDAKPEDALAHNDLGVLCYRNGSKEKALYHYEQAVRLEPDNITFNKNLADFYYVEQDLVEEAMQIYVHVLEIQPEDVETLTICGHICAALQRFDDAEIFYRRVTAIEPWNTEVGGYLDKLQKTPIAVGPEQNEEQMYLQAQNLAGSGDIAGAIRILETLLNRFPNHALAHNDLGVLCYRNGNREKAVNHYEAATHLEPNNITFKKNLADFYYVEQNRVEDALKIYVSVLEQQPTDIETLLSTGRICEDLQRSDDARNFYQQVLEIEPWNEEARQRITRTDVTRRAV